MNRNQQRTHKINNGGGKRAECADKFASVREATGLSDDQLQRLQSGAKGLPGVPAHVVGAAKRRLVIGGQG